MTDDARRVLQEHELRITAQRLLVLEAIMAESGDASAQGLHERLRPEHPTLGLATVYRTLSALADAGVIDTLQHGSGTCYRYCSPGHHHHLTCLRCHRVVEVRDCDVDAWANRIARQAGFHDVTHALELEGTCGACFHQDH